MSDINNAQTEMKVTESSLLDKHPLEISKDFECCFCQEIMDKNCEHIIRCSNGHLIDQKCRSILDHCPICRDVYGNKMIHCMMPDYITKFHLLSLTNKDSKNSA